jgi:hypothetical protein
MHAHVYVFDKTNRLKRIHANEEFLQSRKYQGLKGHVNSRKVEKASPVIMIILLTTFSGSPQKQTT